MGGDSGHGGRTYFRIEDMGSTDIQVQLIENHGWIEGFEVILGGDSELDTIIDALNFITQVLEAKKRGIKMSEGMQVAATREFNGITLRCYQEAGQVDPTDFWATREQIGQALGYANPGISIGNIHNRNKERLDRFSRVNQIDTG